jgi:YfiH family protein
VTATERTDVLVEQTLDDPAVPRAELPEWTDRFGLRAGITLRGQGFSLGLWSNEPAGSVLTRWRAFQESARPAFRRFALAHQVHGTEVAWHGAGDDGWLIREGFDGHATSEAGVLLCVTVADCVPIYVCHSTSGHHALLHAGWRGIAAGVLERSVEALGTRVGARPADLAVHLGVAICGDCYEVGPEVLQAVTGREVGDPGRLDLRGALATRVAGLGIGDLTVSPWCSAHDEAFYSHRRSRGADGRMTAYLGRPLA